MLSDLKFGLCLGVMILAGICGMFGLSFLF